MKTMLKAPGTTRLDLAYDKLLSNFGFNFKLRRYTMVLAEDPLEAGRNITGAAYRFKEVRSLFRAAAAAMSAGAHTRPLFSST